MLVQKSVSPIFTISDENYAIASFDMEVGPIFCRFKVVVPCHKTVLHNSSKSLVI